jgi:hypothetical protein
MDELASEALAFMTPRINEGTSLVNFIIELKDFKRMVSPRQFRLERKYSALRLMRDPRHREQFRQELIRKLTGAHLNASFGIVPFVSDIFQMHDDLTSLSARLSRLKRFAGTPQTRHYRRYLPMPDGSPSTRDRKVDIKPSYLVSWPDPYLGDGAFVAQNRNHATSGGKPSVVRWAEWVQRPVYHATMRYIYTLPHMSEFGEKVAVHLDNLGIRLDPSIIWNAIPFTFLVDWVVDVSSFLRSFARDNFPITTTVRDFCHSLTWSRLCGVDIVPKNRPFKSPRPVPLPVTSINVARNYYTYYSRVKASPNLHSATIRGPKLRQAALAGSLLLNKGRRIYRRD